MNVVQRKLTSVSSHQSLLDAVVACSILSLHDGYLSDHRPLVVDSDPKCLFGDQTSDVQRFPNRRLTSTDPRAVHKYVQNMKLHFQQYFIVEHFQALQQASASNQRNAEWEQLYNDLSRDIATGRRYSERRNYRRRPLVVMTGRPSSTMHGNRCSVGGCGCVVSGELVTSCISASSSPKSSYERIRRPLARGGNTTHSTCSFFASNARWPRQGLP